MRRTPVILIAMLALGFAPSAAAQRARAPAPAGPALEAVTERALRAHLTFLASDLTEGRAPGTRGGRLTEAYLAAQFAALGLAPGGRDGTYFQPVPLVGITPRPSLVVGANRETMTFTPLSEFVAWPEVAEPALTADGELVFVGYGITAPEYGWDDYGGTPLNGKIALVLVNDPGQVDSTVFSGSALTYYGRWTYKVEQAARMGAAGVVLIHTDESATYPWSVVRNSWSGEQVALADRAPRSLRFGAWVTWSAARRMMAATGKDLEAMVRRAQRRDFRPIPTGAQLVVDIRSEVRRFSAANVIGVLPGADTTEAVVFTAHHDHLGIGTAVQGDSIYNGAEDNASGVAVLLGTAAAFTAAPLGPRRSVIFLATTAEESGLLGAEAYVRDPVVPLERTAAVLNVDVANLRGRTTDITALGAERSTLGAVFGDAARAESLSVSPDPEPGRGSFFRSDHFPFARAGVPVLSIRIGSRFQDRPAGWGAEAAQAYTRERYHQPSDEVRADFRYQGAIQQARVMARAGWAVADGRLFYEWNPDSEFRAAGERLEAARRRR